MKIFRINNILRKLFAFFFIGYFSLFSPTSIVLAENALITQPTPVISTPYLPTPNPVFNIFNNVGIGSTANVGVGSTVYIPPSSPTPAPTVSPSPISTPTPTPSVTPAPTVVPSPRPSTTPTPVPSASPIVSPIPSPIGIGSTNPSPMPTPSSKPDLTVELKTILDQSNLGIGFTGSLVNPKVTLTATFKNIGSATASTSSGFISKSSSSSSYSFYPSVKALQPGESYSLTLDPDYEKPGTTVTYTAKADATSLVNELREDNNSASTSVTIPVAKPDLVVLSATSLTQLKVGEKATFNITIKNIGNADASVKNDVFYLGHDLRNPNNYGVSMLDFSQMQILKAGETKTFTITTFEKLTLPGKYTLSGELDALGQIAESNEANNKYSVSFDVKQPQADLIVLAATPTGQLKVGVTNDIDVVIKNVGDATAFAKPWANVKNTIFVSVLTTRVSDGVLIGSCMIQIKDGIAPGQVVTGQLRACAIFPKSGTYRISGAVDILNLVDESNKTNNNYTSTVEIIDSKPDLIVEKVNLIGNHTVGSKDQVQITIKNLGNASTLSGVTTAVYAYDPNWNKVEDFAIFLPAIPAGGSVSQILNLNNAYNIAGNYWFILNADPFNYINESNENNNYFSTPITVNEKYSLQTEPSVNVLMNVSKPGEAYNIYALLKDSKGNVVTNQKDFSYVWSIESYGVNAQITPFSGCTNGILAPCPQDHLAIKALNTGYANIRVKVIQNSTKLPVAESTFYLNVTPSPLLSIGIITPNGGESLKGGQITQVKWKTGVDKYDYLNIYYRYYNNGVLNSGYISSPSYGIVSTNWNVPTSLKGQKVKIEIQAIKNGIIVGQDNSDDYFLVN